MMVSNAREYLFGIVVELRNRLSASASGEKSLTGNSLLADVIDDNASIDIDAH